MHAVTLERPAQWRFAIQLFLIGFAFLIAAFFFPQTMAQNVYGMIAYDTPAETWAAGFIASSGLVLYGLHINGRWFWSPMIRGLGYTLLIVLFGIIGLSSAKASDGLHLTIFAVLYFIPQAFHFLRIAVCDMKGRFANGRT